MKICSRCKNKKDFIEFHKSKKSTDGHVIWCKDCVREQHRQPHLIKSKRESREKNREKINLRRREIYQESIEKISLQQKRWRDLNRDKINIRQKKARDSNKDKANEYNRKWKKNNPEIVSKALKNWRKKNPHKNSEYHHARRARELSSGGKFTKQDIEFLLKSQKGKCISCPKSIKKNRHIDHIIPLSKGGINDKYNIQLLCPSCNQSKHDKDPIIFMQQRGFLL